MCAIVEEQRLDGRRKLAAKKPVVRVVSNKTVVTMDEGVERRIED